jgi:hypothetical protein
LKNCRISEEEQLEVPLLIVGNGFWGSLFVLEKSMEELHHFRLSGTPTIRLQVYPIVGIDLIDQTDDFRIARPVGLEQLFFIRKGSVRLLPGEFSVLPSHMSGDVVLVKAKDRVGEILNSMSHGTGRRMSRSECKPFADAFDYDRLRNAVLIPDGVADSSLRTDGPSAGFPKNDCRRMYAVAPDGR